MNTAPLAAGDPAPRSVRDLNIPLPALVIWLRHVG
jgi:hypothetical protein